MMNKRNTVMNVNTSESTFLTEDAGNKEMQMVLEHQYGDTF